MNIPGTTRARHRDLANEINRARDLARDLANEINRTRDRASGLDRVLDLALTLSRDLDLARDPTVALDLARARTGADYLDCALAHADAHILELDRARTLARDLIVACDLARQRTAHGGKTHEQAGAVRVMPSAGRLVTAAARLLPAADRARYREECRSELWELAATGTGHRQQIQYARPPVPLGGAPAGRAAHPAAQEGIPVKPPVSAVRRAAGGVLAAVPAVAAGMSWHALVALLLAVLAVVAAVCWAIADPGRARRLTALIRAWRGTATRPAACARPASSAGPAKIAVGRATADESAVR